MTRRISAADQETIQLLIEKYGISKVARFVTSAKNGTKATSRRVGRPRNYARNTLAVWTHVEYWRENNTRKKRTVAWGCTKLLQILAIVNQHYTFGTLKRLYYEAEQLRSKNPQTKQETDEGLRRLQHEVATSRSRGNSPLPVPLLLKVTAEGVLETPAIDRLGKVARR